MLPPVTLLAPPSPGHPGCIAGLRSVFIGARLRVAGILFVGAQRPLGSATRIICACGTIVRQTRKILSLFFADVAGLMTPRNGDCPNL